MGHTALLRMNGCSAECLLAHILSGDSLYNLRTCEEHIGNTLGHNSEVSEGGRIHRTAGTRTEDT